jgi:DNA-binding transcriptional LysR family regulator
MTLAQLRAFLMVLETGSFTGAARRLDTSQASVSELVSRLEDELGLSLFTRGGRQLAPTPAATELRTHALQATAAVESGRNALRSMRSLTSGVCTFGVLRNAAYYDLADLAHRFHSRYPGVQLRMVGLNSALVAESIRTGELEAGLVVLPVEEDGMVVTPLFDDPVLYCSTTRAASAGPVEIGELAAASLVLYDAHVGWNDPTRRQLRERATRAGVELVPVIEVEQVETALGLVGQGVGATIVSSSIVRSPSFPSHLRTFPFAEPLHDTVALVQREGQVLSPATRQMIALARHSLRHLMPEAGRPTTRA